MEMEKTKNNNNKERDNVINNELTVSAGNFELKNEK